MLVFYLKFFTGTVQEKRINSVYFEFLEHCSMQQGMIYACVNWNRTQNEILWTTLRKLSIRTIIIKCIKYYTNLCFRTDMYLYAVDPHLNIIIDMDHLQKLVLRFMLLQTCFYSLVLFRLYVYFSRSTSCYIIVHNVIISIYISVIEY